MKDALLVVAGYLAGSIPSAYWIVRAGKGVDVRTVGSGNMGASNVFRAFGPAYGVPVLALDILKGFVPALVASLAAEPLVAVLTGGAAMAGHWRPVFLRFRRGGKMVATGGGVLLGIAPVVALVGVAVWVAVFALARYASLASLVAALAVPLAALALDEPRPVIAFTAAAAAGIALLHRVNIRRLLAGTEQRFEFRRRPAGA